MLLNFIDGKMQSMRSCGHFKKNYVLRWSTNEKLKVGKLSIPPGFSNASVDRMVLS